MVVGGRKKKASPTHQVIYLNLHEVQPINSGIYDRSQLKPP